MCLPPYCIASCYRRMRQPPEVDGNCKYCLLNTQSRIAERGWSSSLGVGRRSNRFSSQKISIKKEHRRNIVNNAGGRGYKKKSGNLNLLEPSGPVQACTGIALPFCSSYNMFMLRTSTCVNKPYTNLIAVAIKTKLDMSRAMADEVLSGGGLCFGLISLPGESYRVWRV